MYLGGSGHNVTLKNEKSNLGENADILISGENRSIRFEEGRDDTYFKQTANNITLTNHTSYPVVLGTDATNSNVESCTEVTDNGTSNTVTIVTCN